MDNSLSQNIDTPISNILPKTPKKNYTTHLIIASLFLTTFLFLLFFAKKPTPLPPLPSPTVTITPVPTLINQANQIPTQYMEKFKEIDAIRNDNSEILPPTIDPNIKS